MKKITFLLTAIIIANFSVFAADFTVTGSFPDNAWDNANPAYKMTEISTTGVYMLEKTLPAGTYEFKVFNTGTWDGPVGGDNRKIVLTSEKAVKFYAKLNGTQILFFSDAQEIYVIGATVGGWNVSDMKLMTNSATDASYTADVVAGNYKVVTKDKNGNIIWNDITPTDQNVGGTGNYTIKLDFVTFAASATANGSTTPSLSSIYGSFIYVGQDPASATWYNGSATAGFDNFNGKNLGSLITPLYIGGEITSAPVLTGVTVKMFYQVDELAVKEVVLPLESSDGTTSSKWKSTAGVNVYTDYTLTLGQTYSLKVWFNATDGVSTLWDSNNSANYVATFTYDLGTGLSSPNSSIRIYSETGNVNATFEGLANVELYNIAGQLIHSTVVENKYNQQVKSGAYLLRINGETHKLLVK